jgi:hypothetical protein
MHRLERERLLALDLHRQRMAFALFEGPNRLLDWGVKSFRGGVNAVKVPYGTKIARLLSECQLHAVILKAGAGGRVAQKSMMVESRARSCRVPVRYITRHAIQQAFSPSNTKYERAQLVATAFPELEDRLPKKRKPWQSEHYQMSIFDATALGVAYFSRIQHGRAK